MNLALDDRTHHSSQVRIQTGMSAIDTFISITHDQVIPIFSVAGLPHNNEDAQIVLQASLVHLKDTQDTHKENFVTVFGALGVGTQEGRYTKVKPLPTVKPIRRVTPSSIPLAKLGRAVTASTWQQTLRKYARQLIQGAG